jgi:hypothetical protein
MGVGENDAVVFLSYWGAQDWGMNPSWHSAIYAANVETFVKPSFKNLYVPMARRRFLLDGDRQ